MNERAKPSTHGAEGAIGANVFPVDRPADEAIARREFLGSLCAAAVACAAAAALAPENTLAQGAAEPFRACDASDLAPGRDRVATDPGSGTPCLVFMDRSGEIRAFDQRCTHLLCPVHYDDAADRILCPCHHGVFSARDGAPLAGPPRRPLVRYETEIRDGAVFLRRETKGADR